MTNRFQEPTSAHRFAVFASSGRHIQRHPFGRKNTSRCVSLVAMVQAADLWERHHGAFGDGMRPSWRGRVFLKREMCARGVIIRQVVGQDSSQVLLTKYDHMVQTLPPD